MSEADPPERRVGYRSPPVEHQFKRGVSGNPKGRPKRQRSRSSTSLEFGAQPANAMLIEEAYRMVSVREGDQVIQLPAIKAVFRAMGVSAMKGNRFAQRTMAELVQNVEAEDRKLRLEHLETMINYKCNWELEIERARELGQPEPQPVPHPDDIFIDFNCGDARVCGPMTKEDKASWDRLLEYRDGLQTDVTHFAQAYRKSRSEKKKAYLLDMWKREQSFYDRINDNLPKRYRKNLADRCWDDSASRPGSQRKTRWPGDKR